MTSLLTAPETVDDAVFILHRFRSLKIVVGDVRFIKKHARDVTAGHIGMSGPNSEEASLTSYPVGGASFLAQYISDISVRNDPDDKTRKVRYVPQSELDIVIAFKSCKRIIIRSSGAWRDGDHAKIVVHTQRAVGVFMSVVQADCNFLGVSQAQGICMDVNVTMDGGCDNVRNMPLDLSRFLTAPIKGNKARKIDLVIPVPDVINLSAPVSAEE